MFTYFKDVLLRLQGIQDQLTVQNDLLREQNEHLSKLSAASSRTTTDMVTGTPCPPNTGTAHEHSTENHSSGAGEPQRPTNSA